MLSYIYWALSAGSIHCVTECQLALTYLLTPRLYGPLRALAS